MNAMVGFRANSIGSLSPTPAQRTAAREDVWSLAKTSLLGRLGTAKAATAKATAVQSAQNPRTAGTSNGLDQDTFLRLLVTQMQAQDPLEPMTNENMIAQLAQFSSLEQMTQLNRRFDQLNAALTGQNFVTASNLLGLNVSGTTSDGAPVAGTVNRVFTQNGTVYVVVGDMTVPLSNLTEVKPA